MHDTVACPSCHARLRLPVELPPGGMVCPRCQAQVSYEAAPPVEPAPRRAEAASPASIQRNATEPEPAMPSGFSTCPYCGKSVEPDWLFCPHCEEPLRQDDNTRRPNGVDDNVKRNRTGVQIMLGLMGVLGGIVTPWYFVVALSRPDPEMVVLGILLLLFLGLVSTGIMFFRTRHEPRKRSLGRALIGTFTLVGIILVAGCSLTLAVGVFAFLVCLGTGVRRL